MAKSSGGGASGSGGRGGSVASRVIARGAALGHKLTIKGGSIFNNGKKTNMGIVNGTVTYTSGKRKGQAVLGWGDV